MLCIAFWGASDGDIRRIPGLLDFWLARRFHSFDGVLWVAVVCSPPSGAELQAIHLVWLRWWIHLSGGAKAEWH